MISVLVYGRNDSYGYNLHKRAAISLNAFAAVLDDAEDEIVFVDYNTPDDFPTFPEAIRDTLTPRARERLRVLRVRPELHCRRGYGGGLNVIEPFARNVGLRRTNSANRWVLNTNTDIILGMRGPERFGEMVRSLGTGFYQAPRIEIPETVWEGFDRSLPDEVLADLRELAPALHLDEIVYGNDKVYFDGPGDFQLAERLVLFTLDGMNERMDKAWHVDSNLSARMTIHFGQIRSLEERIFAYHCDHTRQATRLHIAGYAGNDGQEFVDSVVSPDIVEQRESWGAPDEDIEEIRLTTNASKLYVSSLRRAVGEPQVGPTTSAYRHDTYDRTSYDPRHVVPFLVDLVSSARRGIRIGWVGFHQETMDRFIVALRELGYSEPLRLLSYSGARNPGVQACDLEEWVQNCELFIFDFGEPGSHHLGKEQRGLLGRALHHLRVAENDRAARETAMRRVVGINVVHNRYERAFGAAVLAAATPFGTRVRVGFARPIGRRMDWLAIATRGKHDVVGKTRGLSLGRHVLHVALTPETDKQAIIEVTVHSGDTEMVTWKGIAASVRERPLKLPFDVVSTGDDVGTRVTFSVEKAGALSLLWSGPEGSVPQTIDLPEAMVGHGRNWLPFTSVGAAGRQLNNGVGAVSGIRGHIVYGPYWSLPPGSYEAELNVDIERTTWGKALLSRRPFLLLDVRTSSGERLARRLIIPKVGNHAVKLRFVVEDWHIGFPLEVRLFTGGSTALVVQQITVNQVSGLEIGNPPSGGKQAEAVTVLRVQNQTS